MRDCLLEKSLFFRNFRFLTLNSSGTARSNPRPDMKSVEQGLSNSSQFRALQRNLISSSLIGRFLGFFPQKSITYRHESILYSDSR